MKHKRLIVGLVLLSLLMLYVGFMIGTFVTIKSVAIVASGFVDEELVEDAILKYKNQIANCYPSVFQNGSKRNN